VPDWSRELSLVRAVTGREGHGRAAVAGVKAPHGADPVRDVPVGLPTSEHHRSTTALGNHRL